MVNGMIPKPLDDVQKSDIDALVAARTSERRTLDYKELLPGTSDEEKREFLYDASSFANAAGGDLIFGVRDQRDSSGKPTGIPESANGLPGNPNVSGEVSRLESILQAGIAPRIPGVRFREVAGFPSGPVLIVRVPKSWAAPHMVTYKGATRFYSRNSAGKYRLDVFEIRSAFAFSENLPGQLAKVRDSRLSAIVANEAPVSLPPTAKIILHLIPISALDPAFRLDMSGMYDMLMPLLRPMSEGSWSGRFNFDGFLSLSPGVANYVQVFRSGAIEAVEASLLNLTEWRKMNKASMPDFIPSSDLELLLMKAVTNYTNIQKRIGIDPPIFVMVSLLGVRGFRVTTGQTGFSGNTIDRDVLVLPDVVIDDFAFDPGNLLKPIFDAIAQAAGLSGSRNYDAGGKRKTQ
jgi:hypothetical protein